MFICISMVIIYLANRFLKIIFVRLRIEDKKKSTLLVIINSFIRVIMVVFMILNVIYNFYPGIATTIVAFTGVCGVALSLAAQSMVKDVLSGIILLLERQFDLGDVVSIDEQRGTVERIGLRTIKIRDTEGNQHIIPNGIINSVTNKSKDFAYATIRLFIPYDEDLNMVINILKDELNKRCQYIDEVLDIPTVDVNELGELNIHIRIRVKCTALSKWRIEEELRKVIGLRLQKDNIRSPRAFKK